MPHGLEATAEAPYVVCVPAVDKRLVGVNPAIWRRLAAVLEIDCLLYTSDAADE